MSEFRQAGETHERQRHQARRDQAYGGAFEMNRNVSESNPFAHRGKHHQNQPEASCGAETVQCRLQQVMLLLHVQERDAQYRIKGPFELTANSADNPFRRGFFEFDCPTQLFD